MRPRVETRGNAVGGRPRVRRRVVASMRPRVETRGNAHEQYRDGDGDRGFNEAACRDTRK